MEKVLAIIPEEVRNLKRRSDIPATRTRERRENRHSTLPEHRASREAQKQGVAITTVEDRSDHVWCTHIDKIPIIDPPILEKAQVSSGDELPLAECFRPLGAKRKGEDGKKTFFVPWTHEQGVLHAVGERCEHTQSTPDGRNRNTQKTIPGAIRSRGSFKKSHACCSTLVRSMRAKRFSYQTERTIISRRHHPHGLLEHSMSQE
jgi:hypothetical protein